MPRWVTLAVSAGAALASILVAVVGFEGGSPELASGLDPFSGGKPAWVQLQPAAEEANADADFYSRR
jgi:hypothetical protein